MDAIRWKAHVSATLMKRVSIGGKQLGASVRRIRQITARGEYAQFSTMKLVRNRWRGSKTVE